MSPLDKKAIQLRGYLFQLRNGLDQAACSCPVSGELTPSELKAMELLSWQGPAMMRRMAEHLGLAVSSTTAVVDRLEAKGLVRRRRDEADRRVVTIHLSQEGREAARQYADCHLELCHNMLSRLEPEDQDLLLELFRKLSRVGPES